MCRASVTPHSSAAAQAHATRPPFQRNPVSNSLTLLSSVYYTVCDIILLFQVYYYRQLSRSPLAQIEESSPLIPKPTPPLAKWAFPSRAVIYTLALASVGGAGVLAWMLNNRAGPAPGGNDGGMGDGADRADKYEWKSQTLGWISAATCTLENLSSLWSLYTADVPSPADIGSRIPQLVKNQQTKCEGLSLAMFFFSITGNITCPSLLPSPVSLPLFPLN